jgi:hypothetical protein
MLDPLPQYCRPLLVRDMSRRIGADSLAFDLTPLVAMNLHVHSTESLWIFNDQGN